MGQHIDITGKRFGRAVAVSYVGRQKAHARWECLCDCGNRFLALATNLKTGNTNSCGCLKKEVCKTVNIKHGASDTSIYNIWIGMIRRCSDKNNPAYKNYGARGITVCERWKSFENFLNDMGHRPSGMSIDRINNDHGYSKENCRWATPKQQSLNSRRNRFIEFSGEKKTICQWAEITGLSHATLHRRIKSGWSIECVFGRPARSGPRKGVNPL